MTSKDWQVVHLLIVAVMLAASVFTVWHWAPTGISDFYFVRQDVPIACAMLAAAAVFPCLKFGERWKSEIVPSPRLALTGAVLLVVLGVAGHWLVMFGYDLSRDQSMATFAARQMARGALFTPVPEQWRPFGKAMLPLYHGSVSPAVGWTSAYLPVNSALQAFASGLAHRAFANPVLLVVGLAALWSVARRLWPWREDVAVVTVLLAATSSQLIVNAMTSYAMVGHFALNMVWLALFLRKDFLGAIGALIAGFLAMGLHQLHFHPLFAAPFLLWLAWRREWALTALYGLGYGAILLFWMRVYPEWLIDSANAAAAVNAANPAAVAARAVRDIDLWAYVTGRAGRLFEYSPKVWLFNLMRFFTWENLALIPLLGIALPFLQPKKGGRNGPFLPIAAACAIGLLLPVYQGHGFGYRYLSGVIGCFCLLAGYGWVRLVPEPGPGRPWAMLKVACCFTLLVTLPLQLAMARHMVAPYARLHQAVLKVDADVVLIDTEGGFLAQDLVQNGPDFTRRPKTMDLALVPVDALERLCRTRRVMRIDRRHYRAVEMREGRIAPQVPVLLQERRSILDRLACAPPMPLDG